MIDTREGDQGRRVFYHPTAGVREEGSIACWNEQYVFVAFSSKATPKACLREQLGWVELEAMQLSEEDSDPFYYQRPGLCGEEHDEGS